MASSAALMEAGKFIDAISLLPGFEGTQADAKQAYTQCELGGDDTWIFLPRDQWPDEWKRYRNPVCRLRLALYGHPLSGAYWGAHCIKQLYSVGFIAIPAWDGCFVHPELKCVLSVYVDDFKMAGEPASMTKAWALVRKVITTDEPAAFGKYLGCAHKRCTLPASSIPRTLLSSLQEEGSDSIDSLATKPGKDTLTEGTPSAKKDTRRLPAMQYDMFGYLEQCVDVYLDLAERDEHSLRFAPTPSLDDGAFTEDDLEATGTLGRHAAKILMKILYAARMCRFDLLFAVCSLARCITRWSKACDKRLHRLVSYIHHNKHLMLESVVGDTLDSCRLLFFADADFAGEKVESKSTSGGVLVLVGPNTWAPLGAVCKAQAAVSHSSTEAEVISFEFGLRTEGLPALVFWDFVLPFLSRAGGPAQGKPVATSAGGPAQGTSFARTDAPLSARGGSTHLLRQDADRDAPHRTKRYLQTLEKANEPISSSGFKLTVCEDNEATIKIVLKKRSQAMRHIRRTHRINLDWLYDLFDVDEISLRYVRTLQQIADILTKHFSNSTTWMSLLNLLGIHASCSDSSCQGGPGLHQSKETSEPDKPKETSGSNKSKKNPSQGGPRQDNRTGTKSEVCSLCAIP